VSFVGNTTAREIIEEFHIHSFHAVAYSFGLSSDKHADAWQLEFMVNQCYAAGSTQRHVAFWK
jgi:hypothetical protein